MSNNPPYFLMNNSPKTVLILITSISQACLLSILIVRNSQWVLSMYSLRGYFGKTTVWFRHRTNINVMRILLKLCSFQLWTKNISIKPLACLSLNATICIWAWIGWSLPLTTIYCSIISSRAYIQDKLYCCTRNWGAHCKFTSFNGKPEGQT